ncbi:hypothetical protein F7725_023933 [Dissostichus mawsoni]|uniref:Methylated-DNA--protein-cysteine methyltransferase n=1 Tax=Dissostichus mawsoni TaxID=36200 RepID=A0A7J5XXZ2_DISMA|nr:hypothetical protein F7725_023933 [Dissostichus mawsoni]
MWCSSARLETCSSIPNGPAMMRPSSARGSEAASVEDAAPPSREPRCHRPFCQEVNRRSSSELLNHSERRSGHRSNTVRMKSFIGSEMKKQRESQCTQKTISLLSPLGTIQVRGCENGVHTIQILMDVAPAERSGAAPLSCVVNDSPAETSPELQRGVEWLQAYFSEPQTTGSLPLPAFHHPALQGDAFTSRVLQVLLRDVKFGETVSYKRLAEMAGTPRAARAVGGAMRRNPFLSSSPATESFLAVDRVGQLVFVPLVGFLISCQVNALFNIQ